MQQAGRHGGEGQSLSHSRLPRLHKWRRVAGGDWRISDGSQSGRKVWFLSHTDLVGAAACASVA
jgi:hypothetical protein